MQSKNLFTQLASAALIGTERAGAWPDPEGELAPFAAPTPNQSAENRFLTTVAATELYHRAGLTPSVHQQPIPEAENDTRPPTSRAAAELLSRILTGPHAGLLPEYLDRCAAVGQRVHERHLPDLLALAARDESLAPRVLPVLGARGLWLASLHPDWSKHVAATTGGDLWQTGSRPQRIAVLTRERRKDPAAARDMLEAVWASEPPEERAAFLETLADGLSLADEPLLEKALEDKRKEVREVAADLLARLVGSALARRNSDRLRPLIKIKKALLRRAGLDLDLPADAPKDWARDGLAPKPVITGLGDKATLLARLIAATPLSFWRDHAQVGAPEVLTLTAKSEWRDAIALGLATAATRQHDADLAFAVLNTWAADTPWDVLHNHQELLAAVMAVLPAERREALVTPLLVDRKKLDADYLHVLLKACRHAWSPKFSKLFIDALILYAQVNAGYSGYIAQQLLGDQLAFHVDPNLAPEANRVAQAAPDVRVSALDKFLATLQCRYDLHKEFVT